MAPEPEQTALASSGQPVDPDLFRQMLDNQAAEIVARRDESYIREKEVENTHEYACKLLEAQLVDKQRDREHSQFTSKIGLRFLVWVVFLVGSGIGYALYLGKDALVADIVKAIVYIVTGGIGGYSLGSKNSGKSEPKE